MDRRHFFQLAGVGALGLQGSLSDKVRGVGREIKKFFGSLDDRFPKRKKEKEILEMPTDEFFQNYTPMLFQNAVTYAGYSEGYYKFLLGAPEDSFKQDREKWDEYQLRDILNTFFMPDEQARVTVALFLYDRTGVPVEPSSDLKIVRQNDTRSDIIYTGRDRKVLSHTVQNRGNRKGHVLWLEGEQLRISEKYIDEGVIKYLKQFVVMQSEANNS